MSTTKHPSLMQLSHPYVPYLFGVCTHQHPYKIVMQFEGIANNTTLLTLNDAIIYKLITGETVWLTLCTELIEALPSMMKFLYSTIISRQTSFLKNVYKHSIIPYLINFQFRTY